MNRNIPDDIIEQIRHRADIADVIGAYLQLHRAGSGGSYKALCPFHNEKTPSFNVNTQKQIFHCFGCGKGGDVFRFIMDKEGVDFPGAIHILADKYGITIPEPEPANSRNTQQNDKPSSPKVSKDRLYKLNEELAAFFEENLESHPESPVGLYLKQRMLTPEVIRNFRIGAAPDGWTATLDHFLPKGYTEAEMVESGAAIKKEDSDRLYDRFRNRLVFPIWDELGRIVGFSARTVEEEHQGAKYVNSPETVIFNKRRLLYALPFARLPMREHDCAILCEGQLDVIAFHRAGFTNAVAPQGTAFTDEQARILARHAGKVVLAFDPDEAGEKAVLRAIEIMLPVGLEVKVASLPEGSDPDSLLKNEGPAALAKIIDKALDFFNFLMAKLLKQFDVATPSGKAAVAENMLQFLSKINNNVLRASYSSTLAQILQVPENTVFAEIKRHRRLSQARSATGIHAQPELLFAESAKSAQNAIAGVSVSKGEDVAVRNAEETLLKLAVEHGTVGMRLSEDLPGDMISDSPVGKALNSAIAMTINGEFEGIQKSLLYETPGKDIQDITRALAIPLQVPEDPEAAQQLIQKAISDCVARIRKSHAKNALQTLARTISSAQGEEKEELMRLYQTKHKEIMSFSAPSPAEPAFAESPEPATDEAADRADLNLNEAVANRPVVEPK
ncbi:MAG: DNA primase [Victivallales bacterium]|nr:DNA primase [Victivallales bacterium]